MELAYLHCVAKRADGESVAMYGRLLIQSSSTGFSVEVSGSWPGVSVGYPSSTYQLNPFRYDFIAERIEAVQRRGQLGLICTLPTGETQWFALEDMYCLTPVCADMELYWATQVKCRSLDGFLVPD